MGVPGQVECCARFPSSAQRASTQQTGSRLSTRIEVAASNITWGTARVKVYDKFSRVLRVDATINHVSFSSAGPG